MNTSRTKKLNTWSVPNKCPSRRYMLNRTLCIKLTRCWYPETTSSSIAIFHQPITQTRRLIKKTKESTKQCRMIIKWAANYKGIFKHSKMIRRISFRRRWVS
jgi:hypothetical protein